MKIKIFNRSFRPTKITENQQENIFGSPSEKNVIISYRDSPRLGSEIIVQNNNLTLNNDAGMLSVQSDLLNELENMFHKEKTKCKSVSKNTRKAHILRNTAPNEIQLQVISKNISDPIFSLIEKAYLQYEKNDKICNENIAMFFQKIADLSQIKLTDFNLRRILFEFNDLCVKGLKKEDLPKIRNSALFKQIFENLVKSPEKIFDETIVKLKEKIPIKNESEQKNAEIKQENNIKKPKELLDFAFNFPDLEKQGKKLYKIEQFSEEFNLIDQVFKGGNCELNIARKTYQISLINNFIKNEIILQKSLSESVSLLFFANTVEFLTDLIEDPLGFYDLFNKSPQELIFTEDLSISYHFYKRAMRTFEHQKEEDSPNLLKKWRVIIAGIILDKIYQEKKSYALFTLNFEERTKKLLEKGYNCVRFEKEGIYLILDAKFCVPIYMLDFTFL